ncbi:hypothetical protein [Herpetosiphon geysericola]|uniref:Uncharacterized protein n=1 Tax=Herpetosiphon geysericola TaxID=70996 RepID=A0A0P6XLM6_9CHLR|nr:hypothetical protein [Herpetosiphon geysericola]KPL81223.1 hypothetical protein SE18_21305 [Herpetosiphon geysericola]
MLARTTIVGLIGGTTALIHGVAGQLTSIQALNNANLAASPRLELVATWHMLTIQLGWLAYQVWRLAQHPQPTKQARAIIGQYLAYSGLWLLLNLVVVGQLWLAPQWILLAALAGLTWWATPRPSLIEQGVH